MPSWERVFDCGMRDQHSAAPACSANDQLTYPGQACVGATCWSHAELLQSGLRWDELLRYYTNLSHPNAQPCSQPVQGRSLCRRFTLEPWEQCSDPRAVPGVPCLMPVPQCGISCSGSMGEEAFALHTLLTRGNVSLGRPHRAPRVRLGPTCEGVKPLPRGGTFLEIGASPAAVAPASLRETPNANVLSYYSIHQGQTTEARRIRGTSSTAWAGEACSSRATRPPLAAL